MACVGIELHCREHGGQLRSKVYTHLSSFLPCSRDTLLRRAKKLLDTHTEDPPEPEEPPDMEDPVRKLKEAIGRAMPEQVARFQEKCRAYEQIKASKAADEEKGGQEDNVEEKAGKRGGPKKLFKWNDEIRQCLSQVLALKIEKCKEQEGTQELEEFLKTSLDSEVKPLWPKGWMQSRVLIRESRNILNLLTSFPVKRSRPDRKQPSVGAKSGSGGAPPTEGPPQEDAAVWTGGSDVSASVSLGALMEDAASLKPCSSLGGSDEPPIASSPAPTPSLLDLLADRALFREQPVSSQELLESAITNYKRSMQQWSIMAGISSPPLPPPPPQSSPVGFPVGGVCPGGFLPQITDFSRPLDAGHRTGSDGFHGDVPTLWDQQ